MNYAVYEGRLTDDPFFRNGGDEGGTGALRIKDKLPEYLRDKSYIQFTIASNNTRGDTEKTMYITCSVYGQLADDLNKKLYKGVKVLASGVPYDYDGGGLRNNRGLMLSDCEILQHTLAYSTKHSDLIEIEAREEVDRQHREYIKYLAANKDIDGRNLTAEEIEEAEANRQARRRRFATEEEVQGYKNNKHNTSNNKPVMTEDTWAKIERELQESAEEEGITPPIVSRGSEKKFSLSDIETDENGYIKVNEGFKAPWED